MHVTHLQAGPLRQRNGQEGHSTIQWFVLASLLVVGLSAAYLTAYAEGTLRLLGPGLMVAVVAALVAGYNAFGLVLSLVVARSSLDWFSPKQVQGGGVLVVKSIQPGVIVGAAVLVLGIAWLVVQVAAGTFRRPSAIGLSLSAFAAVCVLTSLGANDPVVSVTTTLRVVIGLVLFLMVEQLIMAKPARIRSLLVAIGLSIVLPALNGFNELAHRTATHNWVQGPFVNRNSMAIWLSVCIPMFIVACRYVHGWARAGCIAVSSVSLVLLVFTYCRAAYAGVLVALLLVALLQERWLLVAGAVAVFCVWSFVPSVQNRFDDLQNTEVAGQGDPNSFAFRQRYWTIIMADFVKGEPLIQNVTGIGLGMVEATEAYHLEPHNVWVQVVAETGALGTGAFTLWVIVTGTQLTVGIRRTRKGSFERAIIIGSSAAALNMLVQTVSQNLITEAVIWTYFASVLAMGSAVCVLAARREAGEIDLTDGAPEGTRRAMPPPIPELV